MISIDSDVLRGLAAKANATVSEISAGIDKLNMVTTHNDWNCVERDSINELITYAKKKTNTLSINTQTFLDLVRQSANRFDEVDSNTTKAFQSVQDLLGDFFSIKSPIVDLGSGEVSTRINDTIYASTQVHDFQTANVINNMNAPIKVCYYADLDFSQLNSEG